MFEKPMDGLLGLKWQTKTRDERSHLTNSFTCLFSWEQVLLVESRVLAFRKHASNVTILRSISPKTRGPTELITVNYCYKQLKQDLICTDLKTVPVLERNK